MTELVTSVVDGDIVVSTVHVDLDLATAGVVREALQRSVVGDARGLVVDLATVAYVDSMGVRAFFELARELGVARQRLGLAVPVGSAIRRLMKVTRLDEIATIAPTPEECAAALRDSVL